MRISDCSSDVCSSDLLAAATLGSMLAPASSAGASPRKFGLEAASKGIATFQAVHEGLGSIDVRLFDFGGAPAPADFLIYDIPVGASEGVPLHNLTDPDRQSTRLNYRNSCASRMP